MSFQCLVLTGTGKYVQRVLAPGSRVVGRLSYAKKFLLIGLVMVVPLVWVVKSYLGVQSQGSSFAAKEQVGVVYLRPATNLLAQVVRLRTLAVQTAAGQADSSQLAGARSQIEAAIRRRAPGRRWR